MESVQKYLSSCSWYRFDLFIPALFVVLVRCNSTVLYVLIEIRLLLPDDEVDIPWYES